MSHYICPTCNVEHQLFGPSTRFDLASTELNMEVLGRIPLDSETSKRGDAGKPAVLDANGYSATRQVFLDIAKKVWAKLG